MDTDNDGIHLQSHRKTSTLGKAGQENLSLKMLECLNTKNGSNYSILLMFDSQKISGQVLQEVLALQDG